MLNVLIVDDEMLVRIGIKSTVHWESNGFQIIGEASNGEQALEVCSELLPDIVLTDIKMPTMDGLEFIKKLKEFHSSVKVIILSCYDDFAYVQEALKLGAVDYILKPTMSPQYLLNLMNSVKEKILEEKASMSEADKLKSEIQKSKELLKEEFLKNLIFSNIYSENQIEEKKLSLGLKISSKNNFVWVARVDNPMLIQSFNSAKDTKLINFAASNIINEVLLGYSNVEFFSNSCYEFIFICSMEGRVSMEKTCSELLSLCTKIRDLSSRYLNISLSIGISSMYTGYKELFKAYKEAEQAVESRFFKGGGTIEFYKSAPYINPQGSNTNVADILGKFNFWDISDFGDLEKFSHRFDNFIHSLLPCPPGRVKQACAQLVFHISEQLSHILPAAANILEKYEPYNRILTFDTLNSLKDYIMGIAEELLKDLRSNRENMVVQKAKSYVKSHYPEDIRLSSISAHLNVSKNYFCNLFKSETGQSFISYLNRYRIEKARELLLTTDLRNYEIGERVGIPNSRHFSALFKKVIGVLPSDYKKRPAGK